MFVSVSVPVFVSLSVCLCVSASVSKASWRHADKGRLHYLWQHHPLLQPPGGTFPASDAHRVWHRRWDAADSKGHTLITTATRHWLCSVPTCCTNLELLDVNRCLTAWVNKHECEEILKHSTGSRFLNVRDIFIACKHLYMLLAICAFDTQHQFQKSWDVV